MRRKTPAIRKIIEDPIEVTREELVKLAFYYWPAGSGPLGMMSIIIGLLQDIAVLRGFKPFTYKDVSRYEEESREEREQNRRDREAQKLTEEREKAAEWLAEKLVCLRQRIEEQGVFYASKRLSRWAGSVPHDLRYPVRRDIVTEFHAKAEEMLESYSQQAIK